MEGDVLEGDILELRIEVIVFLYHLVILENLLGNNFLGLLDQAILTAGYFFSIFLFKSFCRVFT